MKLTYHMLLYQVRGVTLLEYFALMRILPRIPEKQGIETETDPDSHM